MIEIREVQPEDAAELLAIYQPYVLETPITFEYEVPTVPEFRKRIVTTLSRYPYLAALQEGQIIGYAYAGVYKGRTAYDWSCEVTIYLKQDRAAKGVGTLLYQKLEQILQKQGLINLTACITEGNQTSVAFHEKFGYQTVGCFPKIGYKFSRWYDVLWMQKELQQPGDDLQPFIPYPQLTDCIW